MEATELFDICQELALGQPTSNALRKAHEVLVLTCAEGTRHLGGAFGNVFSQVDYLCKAKGISASDRVAIQTMRRHTGNHTNENSSFQNDTLSVDDWRYDLRALALFVSAVFQTDIPEGLCRLLPHHSRIFQQEKKDTYKYIRCIVSKWDNTFITADTDDGEITIDYGTTDGGYDHTYLRKILREGMQLNLLESSRSSQSSVLTPKFIIVEPDFLLDISSIAACFTSYGHHPLLYTLNRLKPHPNTQAILLGNFAGTALDDIIHQKKGKNSNERDIFDASLRRSFSEQALRFCACESFDATRFKRDAEQQIKNIHEAVSVLENTTADQSYLLEASFICEMLGLQGRVDMITADLSLLVEQKAGKNMKIERHSHDPHGLQQESHYVQLLLYYGILRYNFGRSDQKVDTRLLYSRYPANEGLLSVNFYRSLFAEAIRLRNQIVATELFIALEGFGRILPLLTPDIIYNGVKTDGYFAEYVLPELQSLTQLYAGLSPLERAYYERMMTFVYREQLFQKLGNSATRLYHSGGAVSDLWLMPLQAKIDTGNIIIDLEIEKIEKSTPHGSYDLVTLKGQLDILNFRRGDMVYLYNYKDQPDVRKSILYKGTIALLTDARLTIMLNDGQQDAQLFRNDQAHKWAVEHGSSDLSFSSNVRSLQQFVCALPERKALLLGQRAPQADTTLHLSRSYSNTYDPLLERAKQALDFFLLVGPPGTGKTSQALRFLIEEELKGKRGDNSIHRSPSLLLMAYTNRAVDEICTMLNGEGHDYLRLGNENSCDPRFRHHLLESVLDNVTKLEDIRALIRKCPIIVATTSTLQSHQEIFTLKHFSLCIIDEASQILEPNIIGLLSHPHIDRFILIGDHKQLPAVVGCDESSSRVEEPLLQSIGLTDCRQSLFERLLRWEQHEGRTQFIGTLNHQGRMHPEVAQFACDHFYLQEHIQPVPLPHQQENGPLYHVACDDVSDLRLTEQRVIFIPSTTDNEAEVVARLVGRIYHFVSSDFEAEKTIGIIVTYRNQIAPIRNAISQLGIASLVDISIDTVERYQGSQRDVIIYALGISHQYQMDFLTANTFYEDGRPIDRKLNVAMTRARRQLIITGNEHILSTNSLFHEVIKNFS